MKRIVIFCALCALWGCRQANVSQTEPIALYYSIAEQSKTDLLTQGDEIGVFASIEGTEHYFLDNRKYIVEADGRSLSTAPAVYYPEAKQAITFTAYLPFGGTWSGALGTFSVPSDQTTTLALKEADLCWATASSTPVAAPMALEFRHQMARLLITTNEPTEKIAIPNAFLGGILDIKTGAFTNTLKSDVFTTGTELILPAQTLSRLVLTVSGVEYTFEGSILLESGKTTSINLTLNPATHTATLSGSSTTNWTGSSSQGNTTQAAANTLTLHWPKCHPQSGSVDKVVLRIKDQATNTTAAYTVSSGITYADQTFTVPFASTAVFYPYTIEDITLYQSGAWLHESPNIVGGTMVKRGACVVGVRQPLNPPAEGDYIKVGNLYWAKGNLVAVNNSECKVGAPADGGLYFQFGSLIGWKGGANGSGTGICLMENDQLWGGVATWDNFPNQAYVWPAEMSTTPSQWPVGGAEDAMDKWYFSYSQSSWGAVNTASDIGSFAVSLLGDKGSGTLRSGRYASFGVGDPCTYYLGAPWRLPKGTEISALFGNAVSYSPWPQGDFNWTISPVVGAQKSTAPALFFPASGFRGALSAIFSHIGIQQRVWTSSTAMAAGGYNTMGTSGGMHPIEPNSRVAGFPVRCVAN